MARRQRCVNCWKLFTPNYRNRTKVTARQRVCTDCGAIIGHRLADQRYRASHATPRRVRCPTRAPTSASNVAEVVPRGNGSLPSGDVARHIQAHLVSGMGFQRRDFTGKFRLVMRGVDLFTVSKLLGHADIKTTQIYAHLAPGHLQQAIALLNPPKPPV